MCRKIAARMGKALELVHSEAGFDSMSWRKPETSLEEVSRQVMVLKKFCENNRRAVWIDTTTSIDASREAALTAMTEKMRVRY